MSPVLSIFYIDKSISILLSPYSHELETANFQNSEINEILCNLTKIRRFSHVGKNDESCALCEIRIAHSLAFFLIKLEIYLHRTHAAHLKALWRFFPAAPPFGVLRASNADNARQSCAEVSCFRAPGAEAAAVRHRQ